MMWLFSLLVTLLLCSVCLARFPGVFQFDSSINQADDEVEELLKLLSKNTIPDRYKSPDFFKKWNIPSGNQLGKFSWKNCGQAGDMLLLRNLSVSPDPVVLPGTLSIGFSLNILKTIVSPMPAKALIEKKVGSTYIPIPCVDNFGSCPYKDFCDILGLIPQCPPEFIQRGIPCQCPLTKGNYTLPDITFGLDAIPLPSGDYHAKLDADASGKHIGCVEIYFTVDAGYN